MVWSSSMRGSKSRGRVPDKVGEVARGEFNYLENSTGNTTRAMARDGGCLVGLLAGYGSNAWLTSHEYILVLSGLQSSASPIGCQNRSRKTLDSTKFFFACEHGLCFSHFYSLPSSSSSSSCPIHTSFSLAKFTGRHADLVRGLRNHWIRGYIHARSDRLTHVALSGKKHTSS
jgi:hypothetical protein